MGELKIESGIPIPNRVSIRRGVGVIAEKMKVGDSVLCEDYIQAQGLSEALIRKFGVGAAKRRMQRETRKVRVWRTK